MNVLKRIITFTLCLLLSAGLLSRTASADTSQGSPLWDHIISVVAGKGFSVGFRSDGRVAYAGDNNSEEIRKIGTWTDIVRIEHRGAHSPYVVGYRSDGSIALAYLNEFQAENARENNWESYQTWYSNRWKESDFEGWTDITSLILDYYFALGLKNDGTVMIVTREDGQTLEIREKLQAMKESVKNWESIIQIETLGGDLFHYGNYDFFSVVDAYQYNDEVLSRGLLAAGLKENGEVVCTDNNWLETQGNDSIADFLQPWPEASAWNHVKELVRGRHGSSMRPFLFAIRDDGTVFGIADGYESWTPEIVDGEPVFKKIPYDHVTSMCFSMDEIYMLRDDGTVYILTESYWSALMEMEEWADVVELVGGENGQFSAEGVPLGLKADGTILATSVWNAAENVANWGPVKKLHADTGGYIIGIREDERILTAGVDADLSSWTDIVEVVSSRSGWWYESDHFLGLKTDGTVVAAGDKTYGQCNVSGQEKYTSGDFEYILLEDGTAQITGYSGDERNLIIPSALKDTIVSSVGEYAFLKCKNLTSVLIPDGVTTIREGAFCLCENLADVTIPDSVIVIERNAFENCSSLRTLVLPANLEIIPFALCRNCNTLMQVYIPESVNKRETDAFAFCEKLKDVYYGGTEKDWNRITAYDLIDNSFGSVPVGQIYYKASPADVDRILKSGNYLYRVNDQNEAVIDACLETGDETVLTVPSVLDGFRVTEIGKLAFQNSYSLQKIIIPEGITTIGKGAFINCKKLSEVDFPDSLEVIEEYAFHNCKSVILVTCPDGGWKTAEPGKTYTSGDYKYAVLKDGTAKITSYLRSSQDVVVPAQLDGIPVSVIGEKAFNQSFVTGVILPEGITAIEDMAFAFCSMTDLVIPDGVREIGNSVVAYCNSLQRIRIPDSLETIAEGVFSYCISLAAIDISPNHPFLRTVNGGLFTRDS